MYRMIQILWNPPYPLLNSEYKLTEPLPPVMASWDRWQSPSHPPTSSGHRVARGVNSVSGFAVIGHWIKRFLAVFSNAKLPFSKLICDTLIYSRNDDNK